MDSSELLELLHLGRLTTYPLGVLSVVIFTIALERIWRYRGLEAKTRELARKLVDSLSRGDVAGAQSLCDESRTPMARVFGEGLRWRNIALEDLNQILATGRNEVMTELRRGLWFIGTVGSLAPYIGLFGTVVGIMRAFREIGVTGDTGFEVVSAGIAEALIATAVGLLVAIVALALFNWLQVRITSIGATFSRSAERFVQALLYVESGSGRAPEGSNREEVPSGDLSPA
ncbi:MAG: MotA/TolQ/ExbB proton channel family protein [Myxococcales bacterium]|nr:MotA/TolQ/ExbB proton channel family protein [Myxococcales bacterium]